MKNLILFFLLIALYNTIHAQDFYVDLETSSLTWTGYGEIGGFSQQGTIKPKSGYLQIEADSFVAASMVINMRSLYHENKSVAKHLKDKDFFYVKKYPIASLQMTSFEGGIFKGQLSIKGITHPIAFPLELQKKDQQIKVKGQLTIDRTHFEIKFNSSSYFQDLGSQAIKNEFDLDFNLCFKKGG